MKTADFFKASKSAVKHLLTPRGLACASIAAIALSMFHLYGTNVCLHDVLSKKDAQIAKLQKDLKNVKASKEIVKTKVRYVPALHAELSSNERLRLPTGVRNNNLGNIKELENGDKFVGQIGVDKEGFVIFSDRIFSLRAAGLVALNYQHRHNIQTVRKFVERYTKTDRAEYTAYMCSVLKVKPDDKVDFSSRLPEVIKCLVTFEVGHKWQAMVPNQLYKVSARLAKYDHRRNG